MSGGGLRITDKPINILAYVACKRIFSTWTLFVILASLEVFLATACKPSRPSQQARQGSQNKVERLSDAERQEFASRYDRVMERAGGLALWLKEPRAVEAEPRAVKQVFIALRRQTDKDGLRLEVKDAPANEHAGSWEIRLLKHRDLVCQWRLRQVPRLRRATIIIDDMGQNMEAARRLLALPYPLTFSILPGLRDSAETADEAHRARREVMLHLPMEAEPKSGASAGGNAIQVGMNAPEVSRRILADLASVPYAAGVNNHMGSRATADPALMREVMRVLAERRLYFIDSRTTPDTDALDAARAARVPAFYRAVFLDDTASVDYTTGQLRRFRDLVARQGVALAIGHPHATTIEALARFLPEFERDDIELVRPSELVSVPEAARLSPPPRRGTVSTLGKRAAAILR